MERRPSMLMGTPFVPLVNPVRHRVSTPTLHRTDTTTPLTKACICLGEIVADIELLKRINHPILVKFTNLCSSLASFYEILSNRAHTVHVYEEKSVLQRNARLLWQHTVHTANEVGTIAAACEQAHGLWKLDWRTKKVLSSATNLLNEASKEIVTATSSLDDCHPQKAGNKSGNAVSVLKTAVHELSAREYELTSKLDSKQSFWLMIRYFVAFLLIVLTLEYFLDYLYEMVESGELEIWDTLIVASQVSYDYAADWINYGKDDDDDDDDDDDNKDSDEDDEDESDDDDDGGVTQAVLRGFLEVWICSLPYLFWVSRACATCATALLLQRRMYNKPISNDAPKHAPSSGKQLKWHRHAEDIRLVESQALKLIRNIK